VTLSKDGQFVATAPGVWAKNGVKYAEDEALLRVNSDGTKSLVEFRIGGATRAIVFTQTEASARYAPRFIVDICPFPHHRSRAGQNVSAKQLARD
jgi:hypothetical protein